MGDKHRIYQERMSAICRAKCDILDTMMKHELTPIEWMRAFHDIAQRIIGHGLNDEWGMEKHEGFV